MSPGAATNGHMTPHPDERAAADRDRRLGRRRQVDADRPAAARLQVDLRGSARARRETSERRGDGYVNLALLTDGLRAEREQGITIDVAYRYFHDPAAQVHPRRHARPRAVHAQHGDRRLDRRSLDRARRRAQGRQRADPPSRLHHLAAADPALVVCVNKMDLVDYDEEVFYEILEEMTDWAARLADPRHHVHPDLRAARRQRRRALVGDALVRGRTAALPPRARRDRARPQPQRRPLPGPVGRPADVRRASRLPRLRRPGRRRRAAPRQRGRRAPRAGSAPRSRRSTPTTARSRLRSRRCRSTLRLADEVDISRGDMIVEAEDAPPAAREFEAMVCWMSDQPLSRARPLRDQAHDPQRAGGRRRGRAPHRRQHARATSPPRQLGLNEIGRVRLRCERAADGRPLLTQPDDRQLHPRSTSRPTTPSAPGWC